MFDKDAMARFGQRMHARRRQGDSVFVRAHFLRYADIGHEATPFEQSSDGYGRA